MRPNVNPRGRESGENGRNVVVARNRKMGSCATLVEEMSEMAHLTVDLVPWLVQGHRDAVGHVVRQCDSVTVLGYRDRSSRILADTRELLQLCDEQGLRFRIGVETQPPAPAIPSHHVWRRRRGSDAQ